MENNMEDNMEDNIAGIKNKELTFRGLRTPIFDLISLLIREVTFSDVALILSLDQPL